MAHGIFLGGIGKAFESRNYKIYWWGTLPHSLGAWVYRLAVAWLTWEMTHSTVWLGLVAAAHMTPVLLLCPLAGATADRWGHRRQLMIAISVTAASVLALAVLSAGDRLTIELLLVLAAVNGTGRTFAMPSRHAFVVQLVEPRYMSAAIGFNSATHHGANFVGPALGGLLIAQFGVWAAFLYLVASAVVGVVAIGFIRVAPHPARARGSQGLLADIVEGLRYTARHGGIRAMIAMVGVIALFVQPVIEMLPGIADRVLGMGAGGLAMLASAWGLGAMTGGFWIAWRGRTEGLTRILLAVVLSALVGLACVGLSSAPWSTLAALYLTGASLVAAGACATSLIQAAVEPAMRARVMALDSMVNAGAPALGAVIIGWAGAQFGIQAPLVAASGLGLLVWALLARRVRGESRGLEAGAPQPAQ